MSNSQQFDKYVKEQFSNYAPSVHPRIWENIAARNERRKPLGFWQSLYGNKNKLLLAALLLAISTGTGWWYFNKNIPSTNTQQVSTQKNNIENKQGTDLSTKQTTINPGDLSGNLSAETISNPGSSPLTTSENNELKNNNAHRSTRGASTMLVHDPSVQEGEEADAAAGNYTGYRKKQTGNAGMLRIRSVAPASEEKEAVDDNEYAIGGSLLGRLTYDAEMVSVKKRAKNPLSLSFQQIAFLPDCPSIEKNASGNKKYLEVYAGPDYAFRSFSDTGNSEYLRKRKESTKFSSAYSAGVRYTRVFNNAMSVRAGVNYSQINEKFTFSQGNLVQITYIIGSNGDTLGSYTTTGTRYKTTVNKYRSLDIPIAMGYEVGNGKWHANINAGVVVNIYSWQKGDVLDTAYNPVSITTGKNSSPYQFKTNAGVGFIGGVSVYYKLNDRLHLMAEPYFRYNFSPMNKDNITLKQKYQTAGLRIGIRVDLK